MKKCLYILFSLIVSNLFAADPASPPAKPIRVRIAFDIAAPRSGCESGFGICHATLGAGRIGGDGRLAGGEGYMEDGSLFIIISRDYITPELDKEISSARYWTTYEDQDVPQVWLDEMKVSGSYSIPAAGYEILKEKDFFKISFSLR